MEQKIGSSSSDVLSVPNKGGRSLTTEERNSIDLSSQIAGWGADLDPEVRPGVPRDKAPHLGIESLYPAFEQQVPRVKILKSNEHGKMTPVFGTSAPPRGMSGMIREFAFRFSEGRMEHWLMLMAADRVDVVEGILEDLAQFHIPNFPKEMGLKSELKFNKKGVVKKLAMTGAAIGIGIVAYKAFSNRTNSKVALR